MNLPLEVVTCCWRQLRVGVAGGAPINVLVLYSERLVRAANREHVPAGGGDVGEPAQLGDGRDAERRPPALPVPAGQQHSVTGPVGRIVDVGDVRFPSRPDLVRGGGVHPA